MVTMVPTRLRKADGKWVSDDVPPEIWQAQKLVFEWMEKNDVIQLGKLRCYPMREES